MDARPSVHAEAIHEALNTSSDEGIKRASDALYMAGGDPVGELGRIVVGDDWHPTQRLTAARALCQVDAAAAARLAARLEAARGGDAVAAAVARSIRHALPRRSVAQGFGRAIWSVRSAGRRLSRSVGTPRELMSLLGVLLVWPLAACRSVLTRRLGASECLVCGRPIDEPERRSYGCYSCGLAGVMHARCVLDPAAASATEQAGGAFVTTSGTCPRCGA